MAIWLAAGIGLASLLLTSKRLWFKIIVVLFLAGNLVNLIHGRPVIACLGFMTANVLESFLSVSFITYWSKQDLIYKKLKGIYALVFSSIVINAATALLGAGTATLVSSSSFWNFWQTWYVADRLGMLLVKPLIIGWFKSDNKILRPGFIYVTELLFASFLICYVTHLIFNQNMINVEYSLMSYLMFAIIAWLAVRFDIRVLTLNLILSVIIILSSHSVITDHHFLMVATKHNECCFHKFLLLFYAPFAFLFFSFFQASLDYFMIP
jgi:integral membrane sensor domain MASE1